MALPVLLSRAARLSLVCPPIVENIPPAYTRLASTAIADTGPDEYGFHEVALPVDKLSSAILGLNCPPILLNEPPTYRLVPLATSVFTILSALGFQPLRTPALLTDAILFLPVEETEVKLPPR